MPFGIATGVDLRVAAFGLVVLLLPVWGYYLYRERKADARYESWGESASDATAVMVAGILGGSLTVATALLMLAGEAGTFLGDLAGLAGQAPVVLGFIGTTALGFFGLRTGALSPGLFVLIAIVLLAVTVGVKNA